VADPTSSGGWLGLARCVQRQAEVLAFGEAGGPDSQEAQQKMAAAARAYSQALKEDFVDEEARHCILIRIPAVKSCRESLLFTRQHIGDAGLRLLHAVF